MDTIESSLDLGAAADEQPLTGGRLLPLIDSLHDSTLSMNQRETVHALRNGILAFVTQETEVV